MKKVSICWIGLVWMVLAAGFLGAQEGELPGRLPVPQDDPMERLLTAMNNTGAVNQRFMALTEQLGLGRLPALAKVIEKMQTDARDVCARFQAGNSTRELEDAGMLADRFSDIEDLLAELEEEFEAYRDLQGEITAEYGRFPEAVRGRVDDVYRRIAEAAVDTVLAWNSGRDLDALKAGGRIRILVSDAGFLLEETELIVEFEHLKSLAAARAADPETERLLAVMDQAFNRYMQVHARVREAAAALIEIEMQQEILDMKVTEVEQVVDTLEELGDDAINQLDEAIEQVEAVLDIADDEEGENEGTDE